MNTSALDPQVHKPERLRVVATLAARPDEDALSVTRLQNMVRLTPSSLTTRLRELNQAGYVRTEKGRRRKNHWPSPRSRATAGPGWITTPSCCGSCPEWLGTNIRHQHPMYALRC
jgi:DNA-binding MarR family transcriptional regulator